jgi:small subunit ribosomal protein S6
MRQYETTFIIDPTLSGDEIKSTANMYFDFLKNEGCEIVHIDEIGVKQLAYAINKRTAGVYYSVEYTTTNYALIAKLELAFRRDERVMRDVTLAFDKHAIKYAQDKRAGLIGKKKREEREAAAAAKKQAEDEADDNA